MTNPLRNLRLGLTATLPTASGVAVSRRAREARHDLSPPVRAIFS